MNCTYPLFSSYLGFIILTSGRGYSDGHDMYNSTNLLSMIQNMQNLSLSYVSVADISILE